MARTNSLEATRRSRIIVEIASGNKKITDALFELKLLLSDLDSSEVASWIDSELEGYSSDENIPEYRKFTGVLCGNVLQVGGGGILKRQMVIPVKVEQLEYTQTYLRDNITAIEAYEKKDDKDGLSISVDMRVAESIAALELNEFCQINNAWLKIPPSKYTDILNAVKGRILKILLMLEKKYGNLDDYAIDFGKKEERSELMQLVVNIIYNGDSISIGDNNKISKSDIGFVGGDDEN